VDESTETLKATVVDLLNALPADSDGGRLWDGVDRLLLEVLFGELSNRSHPGDSTAYGPEDVLLLNDTSGALLRTLTNVSAPLVVPPGSAPSVPARSSGFLRIGSVESFSDDIRVAELCKPFSEQDPRIRFVPSTGLPQNPTIVLLRVSPVETIVRAQIMLLMGLRACGAKFLVVAAGFDRLLPPKTKSLLALLGPTQTLPGSHKSHAFVCNVNQDLAASSDSVRSDLQHAVGQSDVAQLVVVDDVMPVEMGGKTLSFATGPYAFSAGRLDLGSRLLIEALRNAKTFGQTAAGLPGRVADLACGNGVVGVMAHVSHPIGSLYFSDVSISAVALAKRNAETHNVQHGEFAADSGFDHYLGPRFDAIVLNPPFHHHGGVDEELGAQLFTSAYGQLRVGGELWVVGNRHLGYQKTLQSLFGQCRLVTAHPKFVVLVAQRGATRLRSPKAVLPRRDAEVLGQTKRPQEGSEKE
jgi:23S rRNA (guanine1835-N2)-methyltransferase